MTTTRREFLLATASTSAALAMPLAPTAAANPLVSGAWWMAREVFKELAVGVVAWGVTELASSAYDWLTDETEASDVEEVYSYAASPYQSSFSDFALQPEPGDSRVSEPVSVGPVQVSINGPLCLCLGTMRNADLNGHELRALTRRRDHGRSFLVPRGARRAGPDGETYALACRRYDLDPSEHVMRYQRTFLDPVRRRAVRGVFVQRKLDRSSRSRHERRRAKILWV